MQTEPNNLSKPGNNKSNGELSKESTERKKLQKRTKTKKLQTSKSNSLNSLQIFTTAEDFNTGQHEVSSNILRTRGAYLPDPNKFECGVSLDR